MGRVKSGGDRSFLKWVGGKTRYAQQLVALAPDFTGRYFEPFMGSAAVYFELGPENAVLSDANPELVVCFQQVAADAEAVMKLLDGMPNTRDYFLKLRSQPIDEMSDLQRAARVIYLNKTGFRGLWRVNKKGQFNVPYGAYDRPYYNRSTLLKASEALRGVEILHQDFAEILAQADSGDWVYLDPPYIPQGGFADFKRYTSGQFGEDDHRRLAACMREASERGVYLMMSNSDTPLTREIFSDFHVFSMTTRRDINLAAKSRPSVDLVYTSYSIDDIDTDRLSSCQMELFVVD